MDQKLAVLNRWFGYSSFRPGQDRLIDAILAGRDVLGILPTGGGKSLCYQVPAMMLPGLTLVISPLLSLMADQVSRLSSRGIPAAALTSDQTPSRRRFILREAAAGQLRLLYLSPERLEHTEFLSFLPSLSISLVAIDEAHCISQWGPEFRPAYRRIPAFLSRLTPRPVTAAFTATATPEVRADIIEAAGLIHPFCLTSGFDRPNLYYEVRHVKDKRSELLALLRHYRGFTGIVYCQTRASVDAVAKFLLRHRIPAAAFHAGLSASVRTGALKSWLTDSVTVMVATNAFGMGIDKPDVRYVIHYSLPCDPESYYQEAGRAGRDGLPADCILLVSPRDVAIVRFFIARTASPALRALMERRLSAMRSYASGSRCLRASLLTYFGEHAGRWCGACSVCLRTGPFGVRVPAGQEDPDLYAALLSIRKNMAAQRGQPACRILSDRALHDLAVQRPLSRSEMAAIEGIGLIRTLRSGNAFLEEIRAHTE